MTSMRDSKIKSINDTVVAPIFIIASPRTGSTVLYQLIVDLFELPYISNFTNKYFFRVPVPGFFIQKFFRPSISLESSYGKTKGRFEPSEASNLMKYWFGGNQPSQINSTEILKGREQSLQRTLRASQRLYNGKPLVIKNAWNCFRIPYLAKTFPAARFIWQRRDIYQSALSDLKARYANKGSPTEWNSATPANVKQLLTRPPFEQVIENQYEFNQAISNAFVHIAPERTLNVWYEDLMEDSKAEIDQISTFLSLMNSKEPGTLAPPSSTKIEIPEKTLTDMKDFLDLHLRFNRYRYTKEAV